MTRHIICAAAALTIAFSSVAMTGCGKKTATDDSSTITTEQQTSTEAQGQDAAADPVLVVFDEYEIMDGYTQYESPDGAFSMQFPDGSTINDSDPANITVNIASDFETQDTINIASSSDAQRIESLAQLMEMLSSDSSIDVTAFYIIKKDGNYKGYKYMYESVDDSSLKGIVSTYFADDGSAAHVINATIYNGGDESDVHTVNNIVDTFIG